MQKDMRKKLGIAAVVLLAPGGFILGATLVARHIHRKRAQAEPAERAPETD